MQALETLDDIAPLQETRLQLAEALNVGMAALLTLQTVSEALHTLTYLSNIFSDETIALIDSDTQRYNGYQDAIETQWKETLEQYQAVCKELPAGGKTALVNEPDMSMDAMRRRIAELQTFRELIKRYVAAHE